MAYATTDELAAALRVVKTAGNEPLLQACLDAAADEIDHQRGPAGGRPDPGQPTPSPIARKSGARRRMVEEHGRRLRGRSASPDGRAPGAPGRVQPTRLRADAAAATMGDRLMATMATAALGLAEVRARAADALAPVARRRPGRPPGRSRLAHAARTALGTGATRGWNRRPYGAAGSRRTWKSSGRGVPGRTRARASRPWKTLVAYTIARLRADAYPWPQATSQAPRIFEIAGVPYLGARVVYRVPVAIE